MKWERRPLGEIINLKRGYDLPSQRRKKGLVPIVSSSGITDFHSEPAKSGEGVITGRYGTLGQIFYINGEYWPLNTTLYVENFKGNVPKYIYYFLKTLSLEKYNGASAVPGLDRNVIHKIDVNYISHLPTQQRIASILSAYDDLIENNLKRIKLLEEKAAIAHQEIISSGNTETKLFEDFCTIIHGYAFKSTDFSEDKTFDIVVRMGNFKEGGGVQFENNTKFLNENFEYNTKYKLEPNDIVMVLSDVTREGRIIGNVGFIPSNGKTYLLNQRVGKIVSDEKYRLWLYATFNSKEFKDYCLSCANSATVLNFNNKDLFKFMIRLPKEKELKEFTEKTKPIFNLIGNLGEQNIRLHEARDILLPRLMSGEIEV